MGQDSRVVQANVYYEALMSLKESGKEFSWDNMSYDILRICYQDYNLLDSWVAELYNVDEKTVKDQRNAWEL